MPTIQPASNTVQFGVCRPGPQSSQVIALTIGTTAAFDLTIQMLGRASGPFLGQIYSTQLVTSAAGSNPLGKGVPPGKGTPLEPSLQTKYLAITDTSPVATVSTTFPDLEIPIPATNSITIPAPVTGPEIHPISYFLQINFTAPSAPMPGEWSDTVELSWEGGSTQIALGGTTAGFSAKVSNPLPISLTPGVSSTVNVELDYYSADPTAINVTIAPAQPVAGLTISPTTINMPPQYVLSEGSAKTPVGTAGGVIPQQTLNTHRTATAGVTVTANESTEPANNLNAVLNVTCPSLPSQIGVTSTRASFDVQPLPVTITVQNQPLDLTPGTPPLTVLLQIVAPGAVTSLSIGPPSAVNASGGPLEVSLAWPSSYVVSSTPSGIALITIGGAPVIAHFLATSLKSTNLSLVNVNVSLPWSAYAGRETGTVVFTINLLVVKPPPPVLPPKVWYDINSAGQTVIFGSGFPKDACSVTITTDTGFDPSGPWNGSISRGIVIESICDGTPGQYYDIAVTCAGLSQPATLQINC
jgi:hypothetical protein